MLQGRDVMSAESWKTGHISKLRKGCEWSGLLHKASQSAEAALPPQEMVCKGVSKARRSSHGDPGTSQGLECKRKGPQWTVSHPADAACGSLSCRHPSERILVSDSCHLLTPPSKRSQLSWSWVHSHLAIFSQSLPSFVDHGGGIVLTWKRGILGHLGDR